MVVGEFTRETDLVVIGGGPGGYSAAFRAAELGIDTVLIDARDALGGVCLYEGCVPSKTLLGTTELIGQAQHARRFGIHFETPRIDGDALRTWLQETIARLSKGLAARAKSLGVECVQGMAHFEDGRNLAVPGASISRIKFKRAIIATGGQQIEHAVATFDQPRVWSAPQGMHIESIPRSMLVIGSGYNAIEVASIYAAVGSHITLIDEVDNVLPDADDDICRPLRKRLANTFEAVNMSTRLTALQCDDASCRVTLADDTGEQEHTFERIVVALGSTPVTSSLMLGATNVRCDESGAVIVDTALKTTDPRIMAVGDITGPPMLADKAIAQGRIAGEIAAGWNSEYEPRSVPMVVFTDPQLAWCGLTEQQAKAQSIPHEVCKVPWGASGRAVGLGRSDGMTKLILDPDTQLVLGVGIVGPHAAEMISEATLAIEMGAAVTDLAMTVHPHPTMSELISDAAAQLPRKR